MCAYANTCLHESRLWNKKEKEHEIEGLRRDNSHRKKALSMLQSHGEGDALSMLQPQGESIQHVPNPE